MEGSEPVIDFPSATAEHHQKIWDVFQKESCVIVEGIQLTNVEVIAPPSNTDSLLKNRVPETFKVKGICNLYDKIRAELETVYSLNNPRLNYVFRVSNDLSLQAILPMLDDEFNTISLQHTSLVYYSHQTPEHHAGLTFTTTIYLSGCLDFVRSVMRDLFRQEKSCLQFSGLISTDPDSLRRVPAPVGFTLRALISDTKVDLFDIITITELEFDLTWTRRVSQEGYDNVYSFFGAGIIQMVDVHWHIRKDEDMYDLIILTKSPWNGIGGMQGVNVDNVMLRATWTGTKVSQINLKLECTMALRESTVILQGYYSRDDFEICGDLHECSLQCILDLYNDIFNTKIIVATSHDIAFSALRIRISRANGVSLHGEVTVDGHKAAAGLVKFSRQGINISGEIAQFEIGDVEVVLPQLDLSIDMYHFSVRFVGHVRVHKHTVSTAIYLSKESGRKVQYTAYAAYRGSICVGDVLDELDSDNFLNQAIHELAICISDMNSPMYIKDNSLGYELKKGLSVYATIETPEAVQGLLRNQGPGHVILNAHCDGLRKSQGRFNFEIGLQLPTKHLISFDHLNSKFLRLKVATPNLKPQLIAEAGFNILVQKQQEPLNLLLKLGVDPMGANGSADMNGEWVNPFDLCQDLTVKRLGFHLGLEYAQLAASGLPSQFGLSGNFALGQFNGDSDLFIASNSTSQLLNLRLESLNVAKLVAVAGHLLGKDISFDGKPSTFYIHLLDLYLSTGMTYAGRYHPQGIRLQAELTLFEKKVSLCADVTENLIKFSGEMDCFTIGDTVISGRERDPKVDVEISSSRQNILIDGAILVRRSHIIIYLQADLHRQTMYLSFDLLVVENSRVKIQAQLIGSIPQVTINKAEHGIKAIGGGLRHTKFRVDARLDPTIRKALVRRLVEAATSDQVGGVVTNVLSELGSFKRVLLDISSIRIHSEAWGVGGLLEAQVDCTIACVNHTIHINFSIDDFWGGLETSLKDILRSVTNAVSTFTHNFEGGYEDFFHLAENMVLEISKDHHLQVVEHIHPLPLSLLVRLSRGGVLGTGIPKVQLHTIIGNGALPVALGAVGVFANPLTSSKVLGDVVASRPAGIILPPPLLPISGMKGLIRRRFK